ncbi:MAG: histidine kinase [Bacteroidota bacterium]
MKLLIAVGLCLLPLGCLLGQIAKPSWIHYGVEQGLPSSEVFMALQDSKGYIWLATDRGVARFDGHGFQVFTTRDGLCDNSVLGLYEDSKNRIWFYTFSNRLSYYEEGKIHSFVGNSVLEDLTGYAIVISMYVDPEDNMYLGFKSSSAGRTFAHFTADGQLVLNPKDSLPDVAHAWRQWPDGGTVWGNGKKSAKSSRLRIGTQELDFSQILPPEYDRFKNSQNENISLFQRADNSCLLGLYNCVLNWDGTKVEVLFCQSAENTLGLYEDRHENIWLATFREGVKVYKKGQYDKPIYQLLEGKIVSWVMEDVEGGIWLTTLDDGIYYFPAIDIKCIPSVDFFDRKRIYSMDGNNDFLLVGLYRGDVCQLTLQEDWRFEKKVLNEKFDQTVVCASRGTPSWYSYSGLYEDGEMKTFLRREGKEEITELSKAHMWVSWQDSLMYSVSKREVILRNVVSQKRDTLCQFDLLYPLCGILDSGRNVYLGTASGLYFWKDGRYFAPPHRHQWLNERINGLALDGESLLMASMGGGLLVKKGEQLRRIGVEDGLASDLCNDVAVDEEGIVWVSTNNGLSRIERQGDDYGNVNIVNYSQSTGLLSNEVDGVLILDSLIWVQSERGLSALQRHPPIVDQLPPRVYIQAFSINFKDTLATDSYELQYGYNNIQIRFAGISFKSGNKIRYKYRLLGLDSTWQYTNQRQLEYPQLPPGDYSFEVSAQDYRGRWSSESASVCFHIRQPFWQSAWFLAGGFLLGLGLLQLFFFLRLRTVRRRTHLLRRSLEAEQKALQAQLNPHFIFNALGSIQELILSRKYYLANQHLTRVARLIRKLLNNSRKSLISLEDELELLETYLKLEQFRFGDNFHWSIEVAPGIDDQMTYVPPMLIQPFVENAIWHGLQPKAQPGGQVVLRFEEHQQGLHCTIQDNGVGRQKAGGYRSKYEHQPLGLKIIKERIELLNQNRTIPFHIDIEDLVNPEEEAVGTLVRIFFPFNSN